MALKVQVIKRVGDELTLKIGEPRCGTEHVQLKDLAPDQVMILLDEEEVTKLRDPLDWLDR